MKKIKSEDGAMMIVEATFVFPIMFIVLFFLIYLGNLYYMKSQIESVVTRKAIEGASYCADPLLYNLKTNNSLPELSKLKTEPYRNLFGNMSDIEGQIGNDVKKQIDDTSSLFKNMSPKLKTNVNNIADYKSYVVYATFKVEVECTVEFPIRFLSGDTMPAMTINSRAEVPVDNVTEFIRNTDMAIDYLEGTKAGKTIQSIFSKVNEFINNFAKQ